jgi:hypothetical protein
MIDVDPARDPGLAENPLEPPPAAEAPRDLPPKRKAGRPKGAKNRPKAAPTAERSASAKVAAECREIEQKLAALLARPAIPMHLAGDQWPAAHVEANAPGLATAVANAARENANLRAQLLRLLKVGDGAGLVLAVIAYLAPILIYYGVIPAPPMVRQQLGVPVRAEVRGQSIAEMMRQEAEQHAQREAEAAAAAVASNGNAAASDAATRPVPPTGPPAS